MYCKNFGVDGTENMACKLPLLCRMNQFEWGWGGGLHALKPVLNPQPRFVGNVSETPWRKYGSTPPICTAVRPPFVRQYFPGF